MSNFYFGLFLGDIVKKAFLKSCDQKRGDGGIDIVWEGNPVDGRGSQEAATGGELRKIIFV